MKSIFLIPPRVYMQIWFFGNIFPKISMQKFWYRGGYTSHIQNFNFIFRQNPTSIFSQFHNLFINAPEIGQTIPGDAGSLKSKHQPTSRTHPAPSVNSSEHVQIAILGRTFSLGCYQGGTRATAKILTHTSPLESLICKQNYKYHTNAYKPQIGKK